MIKEALEYLTTLARGSSSPYAVHSENHSTIYLPDGRQETKQTGPCHHHAADNLESLIAYVNSWPDGMELYIGDGGVIALSVDPSFPRHSAAFAFRETKLFKLLGEPFTQREIIRMLRVNFPDLHELANTFRKLTFTTSLGGTVEKDSLGNSVDKKLQEAAAIPDMVVLRLSIWDGTPTFPLEYCVDLDFDDREISLVLSESKLAHAHRVIFKDLHEQLINGLEDEHPIYMGTRAKSNVGMMQFFRSNG